MSYSGDFTSRVRIKLPGPVEACCASATSGLLAVAACGADLFVCDMVAEKSQLQISGHSGQVTGCALSADDSKLVSCSEDGTVRVWTVSKGDNIATMSGHTGAVKTCRFSNDSSRVVSCGVDGTVRIWDALTGQELLQITGHAGAVNDCLFFPDGSKVVSCGDDATVRVWDASSGAAITQLVAHMGPVNSCILFPDGMLATCSDDKTVVVWRAYQPLQFANRVDSTTERETSAVCSSAVSPDGTKFTTTIANQVATWDAQTGKLLHRLEGPNSEKMQACAFSADGAKIVTGSQTAIRIISALDGSELVNIPALSQVTSCAFSKDGSLVVCGEAEATVRIWDTRTSKEVVRLMGHKKLVQDCSFSPDDSKVVTCSDDCTVRVWNASEGSEIWNTTYKHPVLACSFSPDGSNVLSSGADCKVVVSDALSGELLVQMDGHFNAINDCSFSPDGTKVVSCSSKDFAVKLWDASTGNKITQWPCFNQGNACAFSPDGLRILCCGVKGVETLDASQLLTRLFVPFGFTIAESRFVRDGSKVVVFGKGGYRGTYSVDGEFRTSSTEGDSFVISADGTRMLGVKANVGFVSDDSGTQLAKLSDLDKKDLHCEFCANGARILSFGAEHKIRVFNESGKKLSQCKVKGFQGEKVRFSPDGSKMVARVHGAIALWDTATGAALSKFGHAIDAQSFAFSLDGAAARR